MTVEEIQRQLSQLPLEELAKVRAWIDEHRRNVEKVEPVYVETCFISKPHADLVQTEAVHNQATPLVFRDHGAFLNSYSLEDEELYHDAATG